jgi:hypothetical protein
MELGYLFIEKFKKKYKKIEDFFLSLGELILNSNFARILRSVEGT